MANELFLSARSTSTGHTWRMQVEDDQETEKRIAELLEDWPDWAVRRVQAGLRLLDVAAPADLRKETGRKRAAGRLDAPTPHD
jgi:hypothetical protein